MERRHNNQVDILPRSMVDKVAIRPNMASRKETLLTHTSHSNTRVLRSRASGEDRQQDSNNNIRLVAVHMDTLLSSKVASMLHTKVGHYSNRNSNHLKAVSNIHRKLASNRLPNQKIGSILVWAETIRCPFLP
jgi:hypothetical protein